MYKHIKVYADTHNKFKALASIKGMSIQDYMENLANQSLQLEEWIKEFELNTENDKGIKNAIKNIPKL